MAVMQISVLVDNMAGINTPAEHGISYLVEYDGKKILVDTGQSDLFKKNAHTMGLDLEDADAIVLSHGHFDHGGGLQHLQGGRLICHPGCFVRRYKGSGKDNIGLKSSKYEISRKFELIATSVPYEISDKIVFAGEIPRKTDFESQTTPFVFDDGSPDFVKDDSAVIFVSENGLFVVTGCGHSGIVNTIEQAKNITGENRLLGIMGGFHLREMDRQIMETIGYLKENNVKYVYPSHCMGLPALAGLYNEFGFKQVATGETFELPL